MTSLLAAPPASPLGRREPRILARPPWVATSGPDACELLRSAGQVPDPWQADAVDVILAEQAGGQWAARRTGCIAARQNGKGAIIEATELYGMSVLGEHILHSAHLFDTARTAFFRLRELIESTPDLARRVVKINEAHGKEGIELAAVDGKDGRPARPAGSIHFHARTKGGGRGKSPQRIVLDEAFALTREHMAALLPAISAQANPQVNFFSTPPPVGEPAPVLAKMRRSALAAIKAGRVPEAAWIEWGAPREINGRRTDITDPATWAMANPARGIRIFDKTILDELDALDPEEFGAERCGIWPDDGEAQWLVIPEADWSAACDPTSKRAGGVVLAIHVTPDRAWTSIAAAGAREDGLRHGELVAHRPGTGWVVPWAVERHERLEPVAWVIDPINGGSLAVDLEAAGVPVQKMTTRDATTACQGFWDGISGPDLTGRTIRVRVTDQALTDAVAAAGKRAVGQAWCWGWTADGPPSSPLVAVTNATWGYSVHGHAEPVLPWVMFG